MAEDISNKTVVVLVVLTVLISILGTVVVLNEVSSTKIVLNQQPPTISEDKTTGQGTVSLSILPEPKVSSSTGYVMLEILPNE